MKLRYIATLFVLSFGTLLGMMYHYRLDFSLLADLSFYQSLANPDARIVQVREGLRKEEIADLVGSKLGWGDSEKSQFINAHLALNTDDLEGKYFPKTYILLKDENPLGVTSIMLHQFSTQTSAIKKPKTAKIINPETALTIASIIQREAGGKNDMKLISGIIWNRLFNGMKLQIDATLQYAKGSEEDGWWSKVYPKDKSINSLYNTYLHVGLPPTPIANPGLAAIDAAYNPQKTNCLFYLHDKKGNIHCSATYEGHLKNIDKYY